jgi:hypothetical protein
MEITNKDSVAAVAQANSEFTKKLYAELVSPINSITKMIITFYSETGKSNLFKNDLKALRRIGNQIYPGKLT